MRSGFTSALIVVILFAGGYFYYIAQAVCPIPLEYSITEIDERFGLSFDEAKLAVAEAESVWEDSTGQNLFTYSEDADFTVSFVYDERQAISDAEDAFEEKLNTTQTAADAINERYDDLVAEYDVLQRQYSDAVELYERDLAAYNSRVGEINAAGGATPEQFDELEAEQAELDRERNELNTLSNELNTLVREINQVGDSGNRIIESYNRGVAEYNDTFGESREFTQGTYSSDGRIEIYAFENRNELRLVLAHEFGHALSLEHVPNEESVMYFLIGEQPTDLTLSEEDLAEFVRVCSEWSLWDTIKESILG